MTSHKTVNLNAGSDKYRALIAGRRDTLKCALAPVIAPGTRFVWELGCGHGHFLTAYSEAHPDKLCIGIDIIGERIERALRKRDRAKRRNLHFFHADARLFVDMLPEGAAFTDIFILFPDPWPKLRHHKHRIMAPEFLSVVAERAAPECRLYFRTDHIPYFEAALEVVRQHPRWMLASDPWAFEFETVFQRRAVRFESLVARLRP